ncbi:imidazole glycerol phosphate synthase subunit HisH [Cohaesibacter gelatinilyticus]|uniref:Imidazole glycerol phosphate synthase subunit HisH n=1 Tax=Cohaesibacter gelatinilyticus TaxID=372072 RepID=A0A285PEE8_9HYPH|nr:imidazole glycerol phosphate synthase subunit HisH [Cohaesibacter gelatinilyticus]SNZ20130.1 glutamine amidotransferase [Cohaesibacter gelatinilyticus]
MTSRHLTIVDYGMGNLWSVRNALMFLGCEVEICSNPNRIEEASCLILPGVGSFRRAMERLRAADLDQAILNSVRTRSSKILGICLGMHLLGTTGSEDGSTKGLGLIDATVDGFVLPENRQHKIPHTGFNVVHSTESSRLFSALPRQADFYFVHSYRMLADGLPGEAGICHHGESFMATYEEGNVFAAQFHPEKSQTNGLLLLKSFLES